MFLNFQVEFDLVHLYIALDEKRSKVGQGVAGNPDFGDDSPLYGAMGFVRKSERKAGLTRKKKTA